MPLHYEAYQKAMGEAGAFLTHELFYGLAGVPAVPFLQTIKDKYKLQYDAEKVAAHKEQLYGEALHHVASIEAVEQVIRDYHGMLPMAVASGGTRDNIERTLELLGLLPFFEVIVSADEVPNGKPRPDIFLEAARQIGVPPAKCLVFEDAEMGIKAAQAAGMDYVDVRTW